MTAKDWLDFAVQISILVGALSAALSAVYLALRRWVRRQVAEPMQAVAAQVRTSNGTTMGGYAEQSAEKLDHIEATVGQLAEQSSANRDMANSALALARGVHERLDDHLMRHSKP